MSTKHDHLRNNRIVIGSALDLELLLIHARNAVAEAMSVARDLEPEPRRLELRAIAVSTIRDLNEWIITSGDQT